MGAILGVSFGYHDSAAAIDLDGQVVAAAQQERFSRVKHDHAVPIDAARWCLDSAKIAVDDLQAVVYHEKPFTSFERILGTHARVGPRGCNQLREAVGQWTRRKLWVSAQIERLLMAAGRSVPDTYYSEHHLSHAAAAFYPSPFEEAAVMTLDGVGETATTTWGVGRGNQLDLVAQIDFPHSIGLLYSAATDYCGFHVNDGEYKLMGLAPYGDPVFAPAVLERVVHLNDDGSFRLDQRYFNYRVGTSMSSALLHDLFMGPPRASGEALTQRHADVAASIQHVLETVILRLARHVHRETGMPNVCLGGGVALNCVANACLLRDGPFDDIWVQPAPGDAGSALGAAAWLRHQILGFPRTGGLDGMSVTALGPRYEPVEVHDWLTTLGVEHGVLDTAELTASVARALAGGAVVGWFEGAMEFGPRALGHRSILADPRDRRMVAHINSMIKGREGFRPFAPAVTDEAADTWFEIDRPSPYMLRTVPVASFRPSVEQSGRFEDLLAAVDSDLPACTHVDGSARVQTVSRVLSPAFHSLIESFGMLTGCPVLLNTSFNRADEPIVRTPFDALRCAVEAGLDLLVIENCLIDPATATTALSGLRPVDASAVGL